jgi:hypothetical protein
MSIDPRGLIGQQREHTGGHLRRGEVTPMHRPSNVFPDMVDSMLLQVKLCCFAEQCGQGWEHKDHARCMLMGGT